MQKIEITCFMPGEHVDTVEDYLCSLPISHWSLVKVDPHHPDYFLKGFFVTEKEAQEAWDHIKNVFPDILQEPQYSTIEDADWQNAYKAFLKPWSYKDLHWVPIWQKESYSLPQGHVALWIDAGLAFGTGSHETTQLCAKRMLEFRASRKSLEGLKLIDAGCGSGILALSGALLGFKEVEGFDLDPQAITVSRENAQKNSLEDSVQWKEADLTLGLQGKSVDLLLANIQADVLTEYAFLLLSVIKPQGTIALSGILEVELESLKALFTETATTLWGSGFALSSQVAGEWADLCLQRL